jgi:hypothetical protein
LPVSERRKRRNKIEGALEEELKKYRGTLELVRKIIIHSEALPLDSTVPRAKQDTAPQQD